MNRVSDSRTSQGVSSIRTETGRQRWDARRLARDGLVVVALILDVFVVWIWVTGVPFLWDAKSYFGLDLSHLYDSAVTSLDAPQGFRYSPAIAQLLVPIGVLPLPVFAAVVVGANLAALLGMGRRRVWALLLVPPVLMELWTGNIHILMAAAIYFGFRFPALWSFLILTKVTPGIGVFWFALRREWSSLAAALCATGAIAGASFLLAPHLWVQWVDALRSMSALPSIGDLGASTMLIRLVVSGLLLLWAAPRNARWALPLVALLALPTVWPVSWALLAGSLALAFGDKKERSGPGDVRPVAALGNQGDGAPEHRQAMPPDIR